MVYLAEAEGSDRVAVKLLQTALAEAGGERERFAREAAAAKQVARFCTAQVLDADIAGDQPYIVSEYVPGPSLQALVTERGPLEGGALDRLAIGTATALVAIHQAGVVHRDFKPPNVLIGPDGPRVIDFGIARMMDRSATQTGQTLGTPAYMAPEQVYGGEVTPAVDVFAWGATLVFAATGTPPFGRDSIAVLAHRIVHEPPELGALTGSLRTLVAECLDKDPARRPKAGMLLMRLLGHGTMPAERHEPTAIMAEGVTAAAVTPTPRTRVQTPVPLPETHALPSVPPVTSPAASAPRGPPPRPRRPGGRGGSGRRWPAWSPRSRSRAGRSSRRRRSATRDEGTRRPGRPRRSSRAGPQSRPPSIGLHPWGPPPRPNSRPNPRSPCRRPAATSVPRPSPAP